MFNDQLEFITPRPHWATTTDTGSVNACTHVRDFSVGNIQVEIQQVDEKIDGHVVYGSPQVVVADGQVLSPLDLMRLSKALEAAAHHYARITQR